jgi:hypothetical protein
MHPALRHRIATELAESAEQMLKRCGLRTFGGKPLCAAVKASLRRVALKPGHRKFRRRMALGAGDLDCCEIGQINIQQCVTHSDPFLTSLEKDDD